MKRIVWIGVSILFLVVSCKTVKPYQRAYLNDKYMKVGSTKSEGFENTVHTYREGGVNGAGEKGSGGCGCN